MKSSRIAATLLIGQLVVFSASASAQDRGRGAAPAPPQGANPAGGRGGGIGQPQTEQERKNIAVVMGFWKEVWENRDPKAPPKYMSPTYIEHNDNGVNGLANWTRERPLAAPDQRTRVVSQTVYARKDFVLLLQNRERGDPANPSRLVKFTMIEMFRVHDGLLQEHWMLFPAEQGAPLNANGQPGQPQTEQEKRNIAVAMGFWKEVWSNLFTGTVDPAAPARWMSPAYMEHNNNGANGLGFWTRGRGPAPQAQQPNQAAPALPRIVLKSNVYYARNDFVLLVQERETPDPADPSRVRTINMIEMFRVYDNLLQEHWMFFPEGSV